MDAGTFMIIFSLGLGLVGGYFVARQADEFEPVRGGALAQLCQYVTSLVMVALPTALYTSLILTAVNGEINLFIDHTFVTFAVVMLGVILVALVLYGIVEPDPPPDSQQEAALPPLD